MIRLRLAEMHAWVGDVLLNAGDASQARVHLCKSLRHQPWQPGAWKILALASLPGNLRQRLRGGWSERSRSDFGNGRRAVAAAKAG